MPYTVTASPNPVNENAGTITFTITRTVNFPAETLFASTLNGAANGYAVNNSDYATNVNNLQVVFSAGQVSRTVVLSLGAVSPEIEPDETFGFIVQRLSTDPISVFLAKTNWTIHDVSTAAAPTFTISNAGNVTEGTNAVFTVTMSGTISAAKTIWYSTFSGTASAADGDYAGTFVNVPLTFNPGGPTTQQIAIPTLVEPGNPSEPNETFSVGLQNTQTGGAFTTGSATILANGAAAPTFTIGNAGSVTEGANAVFAVNMTGTITAPFTIWYSTFSGTASAADGDYAGTFVNIPLTFNPGGPTTQQIVIPTLVEPGNPSEPNETFSVGLQNTQTGGAFTTGSATILANGGAAPIYSISPASTTVTEGAGQTVTFTLTRSGTNLPEATVFASTVNGAANGFAVNSGDYNTNILDFPVTFAAGATTANAPVVVTILDDNDVEDDETFGFIIQQTSNPDPNVFLDRSTFTILANNEGSASGYSITPSATTANEGGQVTFTITRPSGLPAATLFFSAWQDSASFDAGDYAMPGGAKPENIAVNFAAGVSSQPVTLNILNDGQTDPGERFRAIVQANPPSADPTVNLAQTGFITINDAGAPPPGSDDFASTPSTTGAIDPGSTRAGNIEAAGDTDWFKIALVAGHTYRFDLEGSATGQGTLVDPYMSVRIPGTGATKLAENDDAGTGLNSQFTFTPTSSDTYFLAAGSANNGTGTYLMRATDIAVGTPSDDYASDSTTVGTLSVDGTRPGSIEVTGDTDWFQITLMAGHTYRFDLEGSATSQGTLADPYMSVRNPGAGVTKLVEDDDGGTGYNSQFTFTPTTTDTYFVAAGAANNGVGTYLVRATDVTTDAPPTYSSTQEVFEDGKLTFLATFAKAAYGYVLPASLKPIEIPVAAGGVYIELRNLIIDGLAVALVGRSSDSLFIAFRGTDELPDQVDWFQRDAHYSAFETLVNQIKSYVGNPANEIEHVYVTGHSLGAAMAEYFVALDAYWPRVSVEAVTFANPGMIGGGLHFSDNRITNVFVDHDPIRIAAALSSVWGDQYIIEDSGGLQNDPALFQNHAVDLYLAIATYLDQHNPVPYDTQAHNNVRDDNIRIPVRITTAATATGFSVESYTGWTVDDTIGTATYVFTTVADGLNIAGTSARDVVNFAVDKFTPIAVDLAKDIATSVNWAVSNTLTNIENVFTGAADDLINGTDLTNWLFSGAGNDSVFGWGGLDFIIGGSGEGDDLYDGGDNIDSVIYTSTTQGIVVDLSLPQNQATGIEIGTDQLISIENIIGGSGADQITGDAVANSLSGMDGDDVLNGLAGDDILDGGTGNDTLDGGIGQDTAIFDFSSSTSDIAMNPGGGAAGVEFIDNFNRPDGAVGNGWQPTAGNANGDLILSGGKIIAPAAPGVGGVYRPVDFSSPVTVSAAITPLNGFGGLGNRFATTFWFGNTGDVASGYGLVFHRGDQNFADSAVSFIYADASGTTNLGSAQSTFQFDSLITPSVIFNPDGSVTGSITGSGQVFSFSFGPQTLPLPGANFAIVQDYPDSRSSTFIFPTIDDVAISSTMTSSPGSIADLDRVVTFSNVEIFNVVGGSGGDLLIGGGNADSLAGELGNDTLSGEAGDDTLSGGDGSDTLDGGLGGDTMIGGAGDDTYVVDNGFDVTTEIPSEGTDQVQSSITWFLGSELENLTLVGTAVINGSGNELANTILGNGAANSLFGNAGNDSLDGGLGADKMFGGAGDDIYEVDDVGDVTFEGSALDGVDTVQSSITRSLGANLENLMLTGAAAITGAGNALNNTIIGSDAANTMLGNAGDDTLVGGGGSDTLNGGLGVDSLAGGSGDDTYIVDTDIDIITELVGEGTDAVYTSATYFLFDNVENLTLTGAAAINGSGNALANVLLGNGAANSLFGNGGDDALNGGLGADKMFGGAGDDVYVVDDASDVTFEGSALDGVDTVFASVTRALGANFENLTLTGALAITGAGNALNNIIVGNNSANTLFGNGGDDALNGAGGNDILHGNAGADALDGGTGADTMYGEAGDDIYIVDSGGDISFEGSALDGVDTVLSSVTRSLGPNLENLTLTGAAAINGGGNSLANIIVGNSAINALFGNAGSDTLDGGVGADKMYGSAGDDTYVVDNVSDVTFEGSALDGTDLVLSSVTRSLGANLENLTLTGTAAINGVGNSLANIINGNAGANQLFGNLGDDVLNGGAGNDLLAGGAGNDAFVFAPGSGSDTVTTFLAGGVEDTLDFSAYDGTGITWTITQVGANTVFDFTNGDQITLTNVIAANLVQTDPFGFG